MKGYKIPKGFVEGYRNAIERYPKDSQYAWGMNAVVEALEVHPLEELDENPWHTGTPTEATIYLCFSHRDGYFVSFFEKSNNKWLDDAEVEAWQKITPYEGEEVNG